MGASLPSDYGDYYAWGETTTQSEYPPDSCKTYGMSMVELQSAGIINSNGNLTSAYDAAHVNWGDSWRMPTQAECQELIDNCTWEWITQGGHNGYKVTGSNDKSIFLPASGSLSYTTLNKVGEEGCYRCSTVFYYSKGYTVLNDAYNLFFQKNWLSMMWDSRDLGFTIRPVSE